MLKLKMESLPRRSRKVSSQWNTEQILALIENVKRRMQLWDFSHPEYKNRILRKQYMEDVAAFLNKEVTDVSIKWQNLRSQYNAERRKCTMRRGGDDSRIKWEFYEALNFLSSRELEGISFSESPSMEQSISDSSRATAIKPQRRQRVDNPVPTLKPDAQDDELEMFLNLVTLKLRNFDRRRRSRLQLKIMQLIHEDEFEGGVGRQPPPAAAATAGRFSGTFPHDHAYHNSKVQSVVLDDGAEVEEVVCEVETL